MGPNRRVQIEWSNLFEIGPILSNMVQDQTKTCLKGSVTTKPSGLVLKVFFHFNKRNFIYFTSLCRNIAAMRRKWHFFIYEEDGFNLNLHSDYLLKIGFYPKSQMRSFTGDGLTLKLD